MRRLLKIGHERLGVLTAIIESSAFIVGMFVASIMSPLISGVVYLPFTAFMSTGYVALGVCGYIGGLYQGVTPFDCRSTLLRSSVSTLLLTTGALELGIATPPAAALMAQTLTILVVSMAAVVATAKRLSSQLHGFTKSTVPVRFNSGELEPEPVDVELAIPEMLRKRVILVTDRWAARAKGYPTLYEHQDYHSLAPVKNSVMVCSRIDLDPVPESASQNCVAIDVFEAAVINSEQIVKRAHACAAFTAIIDVEHQTPVLLRTILLLRYSGIEVLTKQDFIEQRTGALAPTADPARRLAVAGVLGVSRFTLWGKRIMDLVLAVTSLVLLFPLMVAVALAVRLDSPGPIIYRQIRVGRHGKPFSMLKFRSMSPDAERDGQARWASRGDDRITRVGRLFRRFRLDELPQLVNVLRGDMSLVGPRPERPEFVKQLAAAIPAYELRHVLRPGLTGWAQINYPYGASIEDARRKLGFDLYYIRESGVGIDLFILARTLRVVLLGEGAR